MAISFTAEQQKVIDTRGCNVLVSAAAGSGKTAVLVERIIRMVCDESRPVDIDRLLVVTFTNAAAAEMRERIAAGISARLEEQPDSEHIQRQATLLHNAQITTIDSFCLFLLRNHFQEVGLDPAFRIADQGEVKLMEQEVLGELLEDAFREGGEAFRFCVEYFCPGGRERVLEGHILSLAGSVAGEVQGGLCRGDAGGTGGKRLGALSDRLSEADDGRLRGEAVPGTGPVSDAGWTLYVRGTGGSGAGTDRGAVRL